VGRMGKDFDVDLLACGSRRTRRSARGGCEVVTRLAISSEMWEERVERDLQDRARSTCLRDQVLGSPVQFVPAGDGGRGHGPHDALSSSRPKEGG